MNTLKHFLLFSLFLLLSDNVFAAHIVGGGITYECMGPNPNGIRYRFTMKVYRDCGSGGAPFDNPANIAIYRGNYQNNTLFTSFAVAINNIVPITISEPDCIENLPFFCLQEATYIWERTLPESIESYFVVYQRCCRTNAISNILFPEDTGATYYVEITPAAQPVCNNSPVFNNFPPVVICNNYPLEVDYSATDSDGDQLVYSFCAPLAGGGPLQGGGVGSCDGVVPSPPCGPPFDEVNFITPTYSAGQPMAGNPVISIDPQTGVISGTPQMNGQFVVGVCVEEYRNGQLLSVTRRDFQFNVTPCAPLATALVEYDELLGPKRYAIKDCSGNTTVTIDNQSVPVANITNFEWIFDLNNGNFLQNSTDFDLTVTFPGLGIYNGILVLNEGLDCGDTAFVRVELYPPASLDLGPDYKICEDSAIVLDAGPDFEQYTWQDGSTGRTFTATTIGVYHVVGTDPCGNELRDTVFITGGEAPPIVLDDVSICPGQSVTFEVPGFEQYSWAPGSGLSCTDCATVTVQPLSTTEYNVVATTQAGCTATKTVLVEVQPTPMQTYVIQFYPNETVTIGGQTYTQSTTITIPVPSTTGGCDSLNTYILELLPTTLSLQCPDNVTVALPSGASGIAVNYDFPTASTDCPGAAPTIRLTAGLASDSNFPAGVNTVCYNAENTCANQDSCCFTITVTSLDLQCPPNMTVALSGGASSVPVNYAQPTALSNCPGSSPTVNLTQGLVSGSNFPAGLNTVCYEASTTCGNQDQCCFTIMVSTLGIQCPPSQVLELPVANTTIPVNYPDPTTTTNCPNPAVTLSLLQGQPSGSGFPVGLTNVCYEAQNTCGNLESCCFTITVQDPPAPCDIKNIGCMRFELLDIRLDSINQPRFRIRATNFCASEVNYVLSELPPGVIAVTPQEGSIYTAPNTGNTYLVRNPNASPFYSVRYRSISPGLKNGQADVFEHRLPQQSFPNNYIHMFAKLKDGQGFEAYLNTFNCPVQPWAGEKSVAEMEQRSVAMLSPAVSLHPNPSSGYLLVDMQAWVGQKTQLRLINALGQVVFNQGYVIDNEWLELDLAPGLSNGLYYLLLQPEGGPIATARFVLER